MMRYVLAIAIFCLAAPAWAERDFAKRVEHAKRLERSPVGREYVNAVWPNLNEETAAFMGECFRNEMPGPFTLVADIADDGTVADVAIQPVSEELECYSKLFVKLKLPPPPAVAKGADFPIVIETSFVKHGD